MFRPIYSKTLFFIHFIYRPVRKIYTMVFVKTLVEGKYVVAALVDTASHFIL